MGRMLKAATRVSKIALRSAGEIPEGAMAFSFASPHEEFFTADITVKQVDIPTTEEPSGPCTVPLSKVSATTPPFAIFVSRALNGLAPTGRNSRKKPRKNNE